MIIGWGPGWRSTDPPQFHDGSEQREPALPAADADQLIEFAQPIVDLLCEG